MSDINYKRIFAMQKVNENRIKEICYGVTSHSGIYIFYRTNEYGFKFAYIGQAKNILSRLTQHLNRYDQHIDKSLKAHGLYNLQKNPYGYKIDVLCECNENELNEREQFFTKQYANLGYQLRNKTGGSQDKGKFGIDENKSTKNYHDGLKQGYKNAQKEISKLFEKNLIVLINGNTNKNKEKAFEKFKTFLKIM